MIASDVIQIFDQGSVFGFTCGVFFMASFAFYFKAIKNDNNS